MTATWLLLILVASTQSGQISGLTARDDTLYKKVDTLVAGIQDDVDTFREEILSALGTLQEVVVGIQTLMK